MANLFQGMMNSPLIPLRLKMWSTTYCCTTTCNIAYCSVSARSEAFENSVIVIHIQGSYLLGNSDLNSSDLARITLASLIHDGVTSLISHDIHQCGYFNWLFLLDLRSLLLLLLSPLHVQLITCQGRGGREIHRHSLY